MTFAVVLEGDTLYPVAEPLGRESRGNQSGSEFAVPKMDILKFS